METILVVEDDPQSAALLQAICEQDGHVVVVAATGAEARAALNEATIALVMLDLRLPDVNGVDLMREIRARECPPEVIITTAYAGRGSAIAAVETGAAAYILKPIEIPRLRTLVARLLEQRRLRAENAALYQRAEQERHRLEVLYDVAGRLASVQDPDQILDLIVHEATRLLGVEAAAIRLVEGEELVLKACTESAASFLTRRRLRIGESLTGQVVLTGQPIAVEDLAEDPRYDRAHGRAALEQGFHAFLSVPLIAHGHTLGSLSVYSQSRRPFQPDEVSLLTALGDQASMTIDRARLFRQEQERRRHLEAVRGISEEITRELALPRLLGLITQRAVDLLVAGQGMIRLWDETDQVLIPKAWTGGGHREDLRLRLGEGVAGTAAQQRQGMIVNDFRSSPYATPSLLQNTTHAAVLAEPLLYHDRLVGVVSVNREQGMGPFTEDDQDLIRLLASQAVIAIENARLFDAARHALIERTHAEAALRESETMFRSVAQSATDAIVSTDHAGMITFWNKGAQAIFGYPEADVIGKSLDILIPERYQELHPKGMQRLQATGDPRVLGKTVELAGLRRDGSEFPLELSLASWQMDEATHYTAIIREITARKQAEAALVERTRHLEAVRKVSVEITRELDLTAVLQLITQRAVDLIGAGVGTIRMWDEHGQLLIPKALTGSGALGGAVCLRLGQGVAGTAAQRRRGMIVNDYRTSPYALATGTSHTAVLAEPLQFGSRLVGVVSISREEDHQPFTKEDQQVLGLFAAQAAIAIENAQLHEAAMRRSGQLESLLGSLKTVTSGLNLREILDRIITEAARIANTPHVKILLVDEAGHGIRVASAGGGAGQLDFPIPFGQTLSGTVAATGLPLFVADSQDESRNPNAAFDRQRGFRTYLGLPIKERGRVLGVVAFNTTEPREYSDEELSYLASFADQAAIAVQNARLFEETQAQRARLAEVFESAVEGIFQAAPGAGFLTANPAFVRILGYESLEELRGAVSDLDRQLYVDPERRAVFHRLMATQGAVAGFESQVSRKSGSTIWIAENTRAVKDAEGRILYYEGFVQDISERKQAEQMKADFVSFVTHQLRTPLAGIKWLLELTMQEPNLPEESRSYIADAQTANERLIGLVNDLLDASRLERGKLAITPKEVDLAALTQGVLDELHLLVGEKGHRLVFAPGTTVPLVWADPQLLRQVVMNLTSNAIKYTPPGGEIAIRQEREEGGVCWSIRDSGIGIPKAAQARLFEKFYRAENVLTIETEGTGLGLYLVRLILDQFQGRVWCESEEGRGSTFSFMIPLPGKGHKG